MLFLKLFLGNLMLSVMYITSLKGSKIIHKLGNAFKAFHNQLFIKRLLLTIVLKALLKASQKRPVPFSQKYYNLANQIWHLLATHDSSEAPSRTVSGAFVSPGSSVEMYYCLTYSTRNSG